MSLKKESKAPLNHLRKHFSYYFQILGAHRYFYQKQHFSAIES